MHTINLEGYRKVVILTGAGVSVASGLPTYRGPGGLWEREGLETYATAAAWIEHPLQVWKQFAVMRAGVLAASPNDAHLAIAALADQVDDRAEVHLVTQNVDGLHAAAGSRDPIELHGNLRRTRCSNSDCSFEPFIDEQVDFTAVPSCPICSSHLRPDITLFNEMLPVEAEHRSRHALRGCDLFIAVGTSGTVTPAANFVRSAKYEEARTVLVNLEAMSPRNPYFDEEILGRAEELLPVLFGTASGW